MDLDKPLLTAACWMTRPTQTLQLQWQTRQGPLPIRPAAPPLNAVWARSAQTDRHPSQSPKSLSCSLTNRQRYRLSQMTVRRFSQRTAMLLRRRRSGSLMLRFARPFLSDGMKSTIGMCSVIRLKPSQGNCKGMACFTTHWTGDTSPIPACAKQRNSSCLECRAKEASL